MKFSNLLLIIKTERHVFVYLVLALYLILHSSCSIHKFRDEVIYYSNNPYFQYTLTLKKPVLPIDKFQYSLYSTEGVLTAGIVTRINDTLFLKPTIQFFVEEDSLERKLDKISIDNLAQTNLHKLLVLKDGNILVDISNEYSLNLPLLKKNKVSNSSNVIFKKN